MVSYLSVKDTTVFSLAIIILMAFKNVDYFYQYYHHSIKNIHGFKKSCFKYPLHGVLWDML